MAPQILRALAGLTVLMSCVAVYRVMQWKNAELQKAQTEIARLHGILSESKHRELRGAPPEPTNLRHVDDQPAKATPCDPSVETTAPGHTTSNGAAGVAVATSTLHDPEVDGPLMTASIRGAETEQVGVEFSLFGKMKTAEILPRRTAVFIACITSQSAKGANQRERIRATWMKQIKEEYQSTEIDTLFFVGTFSPKVQRKSKKERLPAVSEAVLEEQKKYNDIIVVASPDTYEGLINKVRVVMQWVINDRNVDFVAKFDDDCYVNVRTLLKEVGKLPGKERVYFGQMLSGGKVLRTSRNAEPNLPRSMDWYPPYASGAGYMLSADLVKTIAFPGVRLLDMINEDAHLGIVLLPFDIKRVSTRKIHAYGLSSCTQLDDVIAVHYVKDKTTHDCMTELHKNATSGKDVCKSRYCGPVVCEEEFPRRKKRCNVDSPKWELIQEGMVKCRMQWRFTYNFVPNIVFFCCMMRAHTKRMVYLSHPFRAWCGVVWCGVALCFVRV